MRIFARRFGWNRAVAWAVSALLSVSVVGCSGSTTRSATAFCDQLHSGTAKMKNTSQSASSQWTAQMGAALANLGVFTRMLKQMDSHAPDEIKTDMDAALKVWEDQQQALSQAAQNPLGAIIASLSSSLFNSASLESVDRYSQANCGSQVFGTVGVTNGGNPVASGGPNGSPGASIDAGWTCPSFGDASAPNLLDPGTSMADMVTQLTAMKDGTGDLPGAAGAVLTAVQGMSPPAASPSEAFGRLMFSGTDVTTLVQSLVQAVATACGETSTNPDEVVADWESGITPRPDGDGVAIGDVYGSCGDAEIGVALPGSLVYDCGDGNVETVDAATGLVSIATGFPVSSGDAADPDSESSALTLLGNELAWVEIRNVPAQGLDHPTWSAILHVRNLDGSTVADTTLVKDDLQNPADDYDLMQGANSHGVLIQLPINGNDSAVQLLLVDPTGHIGWRRQLPAPESEIEFPTSSTVMFGQHLLLDLGTGVTLHDFGDVTPDVRSDVCGGYALVARGPDFTGTGGGGVWLVDDGTKAALTPVSSHLMQLVSEQIAGVTPYGIVTSGDGLALYSPRGVRRWAIAADLLGGNNPIVIDRWLTLTNASDKQLLVDAQTGKVGTPENAALESLLTSDDGNLRVAAGKVGGSVWVDFDDKETQLPYASLCGS